MVEEFLAVRLARLASIGLAAGVWIVGDGDPVSYRAIAQITPDGSFGSEVNGSGATSCLSATCTITGGTLNHSGSTLLHSFSEFSLGELSEGAETGFPVGVPMDPSAGPPIGGVPASSVPMGVPGMLPVPAAIFVDPGVDDIVVRVTGDSSSLINGFLGTSMGSHANLFLINPEGISFGPDARLKLGGAFVASTANNIFFDGGVALSANDPTPLTPELLTVSAPIGLGFLAEQSSGEIFVSGTGNRLFFGGSPDDPIAQFVNRSLQRPPAPPSPSPMSSSGASLGPSSGPSSGLSGAFESTSSDRSGPPPGFIPRPPSGSKPGSPSGISSGTSPGPPPPGSMLGSMPGSPPLPPLLPPLSELGVRFGEAIALIGNGVELDGGNLMAPGGKIELGSVESGTVLLDADFSADYSQVSQFSDILVSGRSTLEVSAANPGSIRLHGQNLSILENSAVLSEPLPALPGAPTEVITKGGSIDLQAQGTVRVSGFTEPPFSPLAPPFHTYLSVDVAPGAIAAQGLLNINSRNLSIDEGGQIAANTYGTGNAGQIQITVDETLSIGTGSFLGPSGLFATTGSSGNSNSGQIRLDVGHLRMTDGGQVLTSSANGGTAGSISIEADRISLIGTGLVEVPQPDGTVSTVGGRTSIQSAMGAFSAGQGGALTIDADQILVAEGAAISTATNGPGKAGNIDISSQSIEVSGFSTELRPSAVLTTVAPGSTGDGGDLRLETDSLQVLSGGQVRTGTFGSGMSGDLTVRGGSILVSGQTEQGRSGLFANAVADTGAGGNLTIEADTVDITDGATLNVSNFPDQQNSPFPPGQGAAGDLRVSADRISLSGQSLVNAGTAAGDRGNITLATGLLTLRDGSDITTDAIHSSSGGNITIDAPDGFVVAVPDENSDITANAVFGDGGRVSVDARQVIGLQVRSEPTSLSDITASSEFGVAGEIRLAQVNTDLRSEPTELPQSTDVPALEQGCSAADGSTSTFIQTGRGGIGTSPYDVLDSRDSLSDVSVPGAIMPASAPTEAASPVEANNWTVSPQGEVQLVAAETGDGGRCLSWES